MGHYYISDFLMPWGREWNSGLALLHAKFMVPCPFREGEPDDFLSRVQADFWTAARYTDVPTIRVGEALAIHHYLDPDLIGMSLGEPYPILKQLSKLLKSFPDNQIDIFKREFPIVIRDVLSKELACSHIDDRDPLQSVTTVRDFQEYVDKRQLRRTPPFEWIARQEQFTLPFAHSTVLLRLLSKPSFAWTPVQFGGKYDPANKRTEPNVSKLAMASKCEGMSQVIANAMAKILRHPLASTSGRKGEEPEPPTPSKIELVNLNSIIPKVVLNLAIPKARKKIP